MALLRKALLFIVALTLMLVLGMGAFWVKYKDSITPDLWQHASLVLRGQADLLGDRTPGELIRYAKRRLQGHPNLELLALSPLHWLQRRYERPVPPGPLPTLGKGQQTQSLPLQRYTPTGLALETQPPPPAITTNTTAPPGNHNTQADQADPVTNQILISTTAQLIQATKTARPGQTLTLAPGIYRINQHINAAVPGTAQQPITVRAAQPGQATLEVAAEVAFRVSQPYWIFENLHLRGVCTEHRYCEHAFHIFGAAQHTVVRNNLLEDFNAHLKINGAQQLWPDNGLVQYNTLTNTTRRETTQPVTPFDLVGAKNWRVADNLVSNFVKGDGNQVSFGIFMKGASSGGRIERNLVICTPANISQPGVRVGISFGGGGTGKPYCRDQRCNAEHSQGLAANNIVAHCNDSGIDINQSTAIAVAHNTLVNTAGIALRHPSATASLYANLLDGSVSARQQSHAVLQMNQLATLPDLAPAADQLQLRFGNQLATVPLLKLVPADFDAHPRNQTTFAGAQNPA